MIDIKCLDSSAWLAYHFGQSSYIRELIDKGGLIVTSSISLFEIKKKLMSMKKDFIGLMQLIKERSVIIMPGIDIVEMAAEIAIEKKLGAIDSLIYATSLISNAELVTGDNDFRGLEKVKLIS